MTEKVVVYMGKIDDIIATLEALRDYGGWSHAVLVPEIFHGMSYAPSKKVPYFRLPMALPEMIAKEEYRKSLSTVTGKGVMACSLLVIKPESAGKFAWPNASADVREASP